jgi:hypothetical protein
MNVQIIRFCIVLVVLADLIESEDFMSEPSHYINILQAFGAIMQLLELKVGGGRRSEGLFYCLMYWPRDSK